MSDLHYLCSISEDKNNMDKQEIKTNEERQSLSFVEQMIEKDLAEGKNNGRRKRCSDGVPPLNGNDGVPPLDVATASRRWDVPSMSPQMI